MIVPVTGPLHVFNNQFHSWKFSVWLQVMFHSTGDSCFSQHSQSTVFKALEEAKKSLVLYSRFVRKSDKEVIMIEVLISRETYMGTRKFPESSENIVERCHCTFFRKACWWPCEKRRDVKELRTETYMPLWLISVKILHVCKINRPKLNNFNI